MERVPVSGSGGADVLSSAARIGVELTDSGCVVRVLRHRTFILGIHSAGGVEGGCKQIVTAVGQGAKTAMSILKDLMNPCWLARRKAAEEGA